MNSAGSNTLGSCTRYAGTHLLSLHRFLSFSLSTSRHSFQNLKHGILEDAARDAVGARRCFLLFSRLSFRPRAVVVERAADLKAEYDYVVIGGGTSGLVVANRLTEDPDSMRPNLCPMAVPTLTYAQPPFS